MTGQPPLLTARQVAELLDVTPATVLRWTRQGRLPGVRLPSGQIRYQPAVVELLLAAWTTTTAGAPAVESPVRLAAVIPHSPMES